MRGFRQLWMIIAIIPVCLMAQEKEPEEFTSDLFGGITSTDILPKGRLQLETFAEYEYDKMYGVESRSWCYNASSLRYGLFKNVEMSIQAALVHTNIIGLKSTGVSDLAVGVKAKLFNGWKAIPSISVRGLLFIPGGEDASYLPENFNFELDLIFQNHLTSWCDLGYMGSVYWDDSLHPTFFWGAYFDFILSDKFVLSLEESNYYFGSEMSVPLQPWVSLTLSYQVHPRVELGICTDLRLCYFKDYFNVMLGVAWQLTKK